jgi:hypothetical protein
MIAVQFVYHPAYGLPDDIRCRVLADSENHGIYAAATMNNLARSTVYRWRKEMFLKTPKETEKMTTSLKLTFARYVYELGVFSVDNNPNTGYGDPLDQGAMVCKLPWSHEDGETKAFELFKAAQAASGVLGGLICLAAKVDGEWFACHHTNLSEKET